MSNSRSDNSAPNGYYLYTGRDASKKIRLVFPHRGRVITIVLTLKDHTYLP